jgi:uncharacterized membrane protein
MQRTMKRGSLLLASLAVLIATMALASSSASASLYCGGQSVNNSNKCWGAARWLQGDTTRGNSTGTCAGADLTQGTCAPVNQVAIVYMNPGQHSPWVIGTASAFTTTVSNTFE